MPETTNPDQNVVDLNKTPKVFQFKIRTLVLMAVLALIFLIVAVVIAFNLGASSKSANVVTVTKSSTPSATPKANLKTAGLGDKVEVSSGVTVQLTDASIDQQYEQQKQEQKAYYLNNASQSAYLNSDYFKQSNLILKISITNNNKIAVAYLPTNFRLKDSQENQYVTGYSGDSGQISIYSLNPGETTKLTNSYLVPSTETNFKLIYDNAVVNFSIPSH